MSTTRRTIAITALMLLGACAPDGDDTSAKASTGVSSADVAAVADVEIVSFTFEAETTDLSAGSELTWTNADAAIHRIKARDSAPAAFESAELGEGDEFSFTFEEPGTYEYFCSIHSYMTGTVVVG